MSTNVDRKQAAYEYPLPPFLSSVKSNQHKLHPWRNRDGLLLTIVSCDIARISRYTFQPSRIGVQKWKWPLLPFSPFSFCIIRIRIYALFYLLFRLIIVLLYNNLFPNNFLRSFFFSFPSLSSRSGDERERERERVIFFSFPSLPFLFCICQPFIIFHSFSNWETKERERGRKIEKKVFFYFPSPRLPTFFHFPSTSKLGDERERESVVFFLFLLFHFFSIFANLLSFSIHIQIGRRKREREREIEPFSLSVFANLLLFSIQIERREGESRFLFFSYSFISLPRLPTFYHFPHQDRETKGRKRGREFFSFCSLPFAFYHFPSTSKKRESGREIESFSFIFPPSLPTSYHFPFTWYIQIGRRKRERERERERKIGPLCRTSVGAFLAFGEYRRFLCPFSPKVRRMGTAIDRSNGVYAIGYGRLDIYRHRPVERESGSIVGFHENVGGGS